MKISVTLCIAFAISFNTMASENVQKRYQIATVEHVDGCIPNEGNDICMVILNKDGVLVPDVVDNKVKKGNNVYKECRMKLGKAQCSHYWKSWIGEGYLEGGKV